MALLSATIVAHGPRSLSAASVKWLFIRAWVFIARDLLPYLYYFVLKKCLIMPLYFPISVWYLLRV